MPIQNTYVTISMYYFTLYCFFMFFVSATTQEKERVPSYEEAQVWRTKLRDDDDILAIKKLIQDKDISIWHLEYNQAEFLVPAARKVKVNRFLNARKLNHTVLIMDVQRRVDTMRVEPAKWNDQTLRIGHRLNWKEYPPLRVINEYLIYLIENFPSICNVSIIGHTAESRPIQMVKISNGNPNNTALLITAGMHAREWVGITSALYLIDKIVTKFDQLSSYMKAVDWTIIPVLNPDGYEYTHTRDRLWRKNRRKLQNCRGIDINRNFGTDWDVPGITDKNHCYEGYAGPYAFSEPESLALRDMILASDKKPYAMIDLHSYGQLILYPWSAKPNPTSDRRLLWSTARLMAEKIFNTTGKSYNYGAAYHKVYPATGAAIDWMYSTGVTLAFGMELGDQGDHGFLMPPEHIEPTGRELVAAVNELVRAFNPEFKSNMYGSWF